MKAKFKGGPMNGKTQEFEENMYSSQLRFAKPQKVPYTSIMDEEPLVRIQYGAYQRSYVTQKNGARVYVWLGWEDGTF